ncbi:MAG: preprotein translocase subunit SecG [Verrucomicrobiales bacterium]
MSVIFYILLVILFVICILATLIVLMQRPKQEGLGAAFGSGMMDSTFGAGATNVLQKWTVYLAAAFFLVSAAMGMITSKIQTDLYAKGELTNAPAVPAPDPEPVEATLPGSDLPVPAPVVPPADATPAPADATLDAGATEVPAPEASDAEGAAEEKN